MNLPVFAACNLGGFTDPWHVRWKERVSTSSSASKCANSFTTLIHPWYLTCNSTTTTCVMHRSVDFCKQRGAGVVFTLEWYGIHVIGSAMCIIQKCTHLRTVHSSAVNTLKSVQNSAMCSLEWHGIHIGHSAAANCFLLSNCSFSFSFGKAFPLPPGLGSSKQHCWCIVASVFLKYCWLSQGWLSHH